VAGILQDAPGDIKAETAEFVTVLQYQWVADSQDFLTEFSSPFKVLFPTLLAVYHLDSGNTGPGGAAPLHPATRRSKTWASAAILTSAIVLFAGEAPDRESLEPWIAVCERVGGSGGSRVIGSQGSIPRATPQRLAQLGIKIEPVTELPGPKEKWD
jgi:hypothetical protein